MKARDSVKNYDSKIREYVNYSYRQSKNACKNYTSRPAGSENEKELQKHLVSELERKEFDYESYDIIDYKYEPPFNPYSLFQMAAKKLSNTATTDIEAGINLLKGAEMSYPAYYCNVLD